MKMVQFGSWRDKVTILYINHNQTFVRSRSSSKTVKKINFCSSDKYHDILFFTFFLFKFEVISCTQRTLNLIRGSLEPLSLT